MDANRPKVLDLYCGAGGFSLGFEAAGFDIVAAVDEYPRHVVTHSYNFPDCNVYCDKVSKVQLPPYMKFDVIIGGCPCQSFSQGGKQDPNDPRSQELLIFLSLVRLYQPKYFVIENVPPLLTNTKFHPLLEQFLDRVDSMGYFVVSPIKVLNAKDFGVCQDRKRVFILGYRGDQRQPTYPFGGKKSAPLIRILDDLAKVEPFVNEVDEGIVRSRLRNCYLRGRIKDREECLRIYNHVASKHSESVIRRFQGTPPGTREPISRFHKLDPEGISHTLRAGTLRGKGSHTAPRPIHYSLPRCITVREAARIQSFPDWFEFDSTKHIGHLQVGNAVPPVLAREVGEKILEALRITQYEICT